MLYRASVIHVHRFIRLMIASAQGFELLDGDLPILKRQFIFQFSQ